VSILEKIISDLKSKIPFGKKPKVDDEESDQIEDEETNSSQQSDETDSTDVSVKLKEVDEDGELSEDEVSEPTSLVDKLKSKISALRGGSSKEEALTDDKAKKKKFFQIIIISLVVVYIASELLMPTEEEAVPEVDPKSLLKERKRPVKKPVADNAQAPRTDETAQATETPSETPAEAPSESSPQPSTTEVEPSVPDQVPGELDLTEESPDAPSVEVAPGPDTALTDEPTAPISEVEPSPDMTERPLDNTGVASDMSDSVDGRIEDTSGDNITDQILLDLEKQAKDTTPVPVKKEYVSPPDYEYRGRGLVYNCLGKHWACVDAPSYKACEDNASSVKFLQRNTECYPFNVYETIRGCEDMQNRMVSSSAKTNFCNE
jgi:hypothetical protein